MTINWEWSGKRAKKLGIVLLIGVDIHYLFPDMFVYVSGLMMFILGFKCELGRIKFK